MYVGDGDDVGGSGQRIVEPLVSMSYLSQISNTLIGHCGLSLTYTLTLY